MSENSFDWKLEPGKMKKEKVLVSSSCTKWYTHIYSIGYKYSRVKGCFTRTKSNRNINNVCAVEFLQHFTVCISFMIFIFFFGKMCATHQTKRKEKFTHLRDDDVRIRICLNRRNWNEEKKNRTKNSNIEIFYMNEMILYCCLKYLMLLGIRYAYERRSLFFSLAKNLPLHYLLAFL